MATPQTQFAVIPNIEESEQPEAAEAMDFFGTPSREVDDSRNWATDVATAEMVRKELYPIIQQTRTDMVQHHEDMRAVRRMVKLIHDAGQKYIGRSDIYLPIWAKCRNTQVSALIRGLFPSDEYMDVTSQTATNDPDADKGVKALLQHEFEEHAKLRDEMKRFLRNELDYGIGVLKFWWNKPEKKYVRKQGRLKNIGGGKSAADYQPDASDCSGLRTSSRSPFNWYIYPLTANNLDECEVIFEDIGVSKRYARAKVESGEWLIDDVDSIVTPTETTTEKTEQLAVTISNASPGSGGQLSDSEIGDIKTVTECWVDLVLPDAAYMDDEEPGTPLPCKVMMSADRVLSVIRNPFWHQKPPYLEQRTDQEDGSFFNMGDGSYMRGLNLIANDFLNQLNDNGTMAMNPLTFVNPAFLAAPLSSIYPGAVWEMTDIEQGVKMHTPPTEQLQHGMALVQMVTGMAENYSATPPIIQGSKASSTATGTSVLQKNAMNPLQDRVEDLEAGVLRPLMKYTWILLQQYADADYIVSVAGRPLKVTREQLAGTFFFRWLASSQAQNQQMKIQQGMQLIQMVTPLIGYLTQLGYVVDPVVIIKRLYGDNGWRGFEDFIHKLKEGQMMPQWQQAIPPPSVQGVQQGLGNMRNELEQISGKENAPSMVPGQGEDFPAVRAQADQLAGMMGNIR